MLLTNTQQSKLRSLIQNGLPIVSRPYQQLADELGCDEKSVIERIESWQQDGLIKRFGVVVRHHKLGYKHNAMVVWDIPDSLVDGFGDKIKSVGRVSLCYRRPRRLPDWPFNLFCMFHGKDRARVKEQIELLIDEAGLSEFPHKILFSYQQFKQCGGQYHAPSNEQKKVGNAG